MLDGILCLLPPNLSDSSSEQHGSLIIEYKGFPKELNRSFLCFDNEILVFILFPNKENVLVNYSYEAFCAAPRN